MAGDRFTNRLDWATISAAFAIWFAHFLLLWTASSVFPHQTLARWIAGGLTLLALAALGALWLRRGRPPITRGAGLGLAIAAVTIAYGMVPALIG